MKACAALLILVLLGVLGISILGVSQQMGNDPTISPRLPTTYPRDGYFYSDQTVIPLGGCVNFWWSRPGATAVYFVPSNGPVDFREPVALEGTLTVCPSGAFNFVIGEPIDYRLVAEYPDGTAWESVITIQFVDVPVAPPTLVIPSPFPLETPTPTPSPFLPPTSSTDTPITMIAVHIQWFERGFMVELVDSSTMFETIRPCAYAYSYTTGIIMPDPGMGYNYCTTSVGLPESLITEAPPSLLAPTGVFGKIWAYHALIRDELGYAIATETYYDGAVPPMESTLSGGPLYMPIITLPDGRQLYCGSRAASSGDCQLR